VGWIERDAEASFDSAQFLCTQPGLQVDLSAFETPNDLSDAESVNLNEAPSSGSY
jgi:hypothetical protein